MRRERFVRQLEANLIVALTGATVSNGIRTDFHGHFNLALCQQRPCNGRAEQVFAFARAGRSGIAVTCVPRLIGSLPGRCVSPPMGRDCWGDTAVVLPCGLGASPLSNAFTGQELTPKPSPGNGTRLDVGDLYADFPIALLTGHGEIG